MRYWFVLSWNAEVIQHRAIYRLKQDAIDVARALLTPGPDGTKAGIFSAEVQEIFAPGDPAERDRVNEGRL